MYRCGRGILCPIPDKTRDKGQLSNERIDSRIRPFRDKIPKMTVCDLAYS